MPTCDVVHRNVSFATDAGLRDLLQFGSIVEVRGERVRELRNRITILQSPRERCVFIPHRGNDVVATVAETLWVLAGRDDIGWLIPYLPRAHEFSDDGVTWRGAYGPRLRRWNGVDQIHQIVCLLKEEWATRRAVISLYDPDRDFVQSKDIPCNNWLHWLIRDGRLHLSVAVRSNDIIWGFSGVDSFEWSVLQELVARWVGVQVGDVTYLATSFHLYDRHDRRARRMVEAFNGITCYDYGLVAPSFQIPLDDFDAALSAWFAMEKEVRANPNRTIDSARVLGDPFLSIALDMVRLHHGVECGWGPDRLGEELAQLPACDLTAATYDLYSRQFPKVLALVRNPHLAAFFGAYRTAPPQDPAGAHSVVDAINALHIRKNAVYGKAWKKRGEVTSILCNVARKVDRLEQSALSGDEPDGETAFETAIDLFVYLTKYRLFLLDLSPVDLADNLPHSLRPYSDNTDAFTLIVDQYVHAAPPSESETLIVQELLTSFERLHAMATTGSASVEERFASVTRLADLSFGLAMVFVARDSDLARRLVLRTNPQPELGE